jgi:hypothetical protein
MRSSRGAPRRRPFPKPRARRSESTPSARSERRRSAVSSPWTIRHARPQRRLRGTAAADGLQVGRCPRECCTWRVRDRSRAGGRGRQSAAASRSQPRASSPPLSRYPQVSVGSTARFGLLGPRVVRHLLSILMESAFDHAALQRMVDLGTDQERGGGRVRGLSWLEATATTAKAHEPAAGVWPDPRTDPARVRVDHRWVQLAA